MLKSFTARGPDRPVVQARFTRAVPSQRLLTPSLSLRIRVCRPNTRVDGGLLGPCFKTGGWKPIRQYPLHADDATADTKRPSCGGTPVRPRISPRRVHGTPGFSSASGTGSPPGYNRTDRVHGTVPTFPAVLSGPLSKLADIGLPARENSRPPISDCARGGFRGSHTHTGPLSTDESPQGNY